MKQSMRASIFASCLFLFLCSSFFYEFDMFVPAIFLFGLAILIAVEEVGSSIKSHIDKTLIKKQN